MSQFSYLSNKIIKADFHSAPFKHILIEDFLLPEHLDVVLSDPQVHFEEVGSTPELTRRLIVSPPEERVPQLRVMVSPIDYRDTTTPSQQNWLNISMEMNLKKL